MKFSSSFLQNSKSVDAMIEREQCFNITNKLSSKKWLLQG